MANFSPTRCSKTASIPGEKTAELSPASSSSLLSGSARTAGMAAPASTESVADLTNSRRVRDIIDPPKLSIYRSVEPRQRARADSMVGTCYHGGGGAGPCFWNSDVHHGK